MRGRIAPVSKDTRFEMLKNVGAPRIRLDGVRKVSGNATYAADRRLERQVFAWPVRSPVAAGRLESIDVERAMAVAGVLAVYTHHNSADVLRWGADNPAIGLSAEALGRQALLAAEPEPAPLYQPLTSPEILFAGQWIALVVAEEPEISRYAASLLTLEFAASGASIEMDAETDDFLAPSFFFGAEMQVQRGDGAAADSSAAAVCERYATPAQMHHPMEPSATVADWDGDGVTLYDSTQGVWATQAYVARSLGIATDKVRVLSPFVGGGFGGKNQMWPHQALAAHISRALRRPVKLQLTRADMAVASGHRSPTLQDVALRAQREGRLDGLTHLSRVPTSMRGNFFEPCGLNSLLLYETGALEVRHLVTRKNIPSPTVFRGPGETPGSFALECALDELAHQLRMDPISLRRRNFSARDHYHGRDWSSNRLLDCYDQGKARFGWADGYQEPRAKREGTELIGYGMATTAYPAPALTATVQLRLRTDGPLIVETSATDIGTGMYTLLAQAVSDALDWPFENIVVRLGDSALPNAPTAGRSKSTASILPAAARACRNLLNKLREMSQDDDLASNHSPGRILEAAGRTELLVEGTSDGMPTGDDLSFYSFGAHFVEVRVDEPLGRVRVVRVVSALDCGRIVNPLTATSQIKGGIVFGIGMALMEQGEFHPVHARLVNDNFADYAVPVNADVPDIEVIFVETPDDRFNEFGARGVGEIGLPGVAAAIANAVFDATGRRIRSLPITPAKIVRAVP